MTVDDAAALAARPFDLKLDATPRNLKRVLAKALTVHPATLARAFNAQMDLNPCEYLRNVRLDRGARLLATTNMICQEVAVVPFLWIVPLSLYLLSFALCFAGEKWYPRTWYSSALILAMFLACWLLNKHLDLSVRLHTLGASAVLFVCCMVCRGRG